ncbi:hypothetical protein DFH07DRAFT_755624 [Mycena maculata]|uniref:Uncharacterized protein n=1 Tax=Mycena maculata TaxID=230809 RepID=A0AAD7MUN9_9AGAR|nr:hypothetical protein DFH07DRAFT_755624 [Mycena maculata]
MNLATALSSTHARLEVLNELIKFVGTRTVPAQHRIFLIAAKQGWSDKKLLEHLHLAASGDYSAYTFSDYEIDLTVLLDEPGGAGAVYAMNHSIFALPSLNTIQPYRRQRKLVTCTDGVRITDISQNIATLFGSDSSEGDHAFEVPHPGRCGHTLSFDELATEKRVEYDPATDNMTGLCLEHLGSSGLETLKVGSGIENVEAAVAAIRAERVHIAHETCVGAIAHLALSRLAYPSPTFLAAVTFVHIAFASSISPFNSLHGPILSVATDGDPNRRATLFMLCMHQEILPGNPLYPFVKNLDGLNRCVGEDNLTGDFDYKHDFKHS